MTATEDQASQPAFAKADPARRIPTLDSDMVGRLSSALGHAVAQCWSDLPQEAQQGLFEAAVQAEGEGIRQQLAIFLHGKHARTVDTLHARATPEPDSLGG